MFQVSFQKARSCCFHLAGPGEQPAALLCVQAKLCLPGHWQLGHSLYQAQAPQAIQRISFHTDNTTTTTKSEDGHYARTDYAGTVPVL